MKGKTLIAIPRSLKLIFNLIIHSTYVLFSIFQVCFFHCEFCNGFWGWLCNFNNDDWAPESLCQAFSFSLFFFFNKYRIWGWDLVLGVDNKTATPTCTVRSHKLHSDLIGQNSSKILSQKGVKHASMKN